MTDPHELAREAGDDLTEYGLWRLEDGGGDLGAFALATGRAEDAFKYAALLYPRFIEVEGAVVLADHYDPENWREWRQQLNPFAAADMVNHTHVDWLLGGDGEEAGPLDVPLGRLLAFFWQLAVDRQFPAAGVEVTAPSGIVYVRQPQMLRGSAT